LLLFFLRVEADAALLEADTDVACRHRDESNCFWPPGSMTGEKKRSSNEELGWRWRLRRDCGAAE